MPELEINGDCSCAEEDSDDIEQEFQSIYAASTELDANQCELSDNWLFRKANARNCMNGSTSSIVSASSPVGMLVPSPTHECRTLIGDRNADEISDLSEIGSDLDNDEFSEDERNRSGASLIDIPHVLIGSKTLIGGKNEMSSFEQSKAALIDLLEPGSLVSEQSLTGQSPVISEAKNNLILIEDRSGESMHINMDFGSKIVGNSHHDELINFDSFDENENQRKAAMNLESNDVEIVTKAQKKFDLEPVPAPR